MENKEGEQQEEKAEKNRETDRCSVNDLQQEPGVDSKRKKKKEKRSGSQRKKIKKYPEMQMVYMCKAEARKLHFKT